MESLLSVDDSILEIETHADLLHPKFFLWGPPVFSTLSVTPVVVVDVAAKETKPEEGETFVPFDIVLVVDVSGSMGHVMGNVR
jgi:hypothetical protein